MRTQVVAFFLSLGIAALATPVILRLARRLSLYDVPDGQRKIHDAPIPRLGGIAIAAGFVAPLVGLLFYSNFYASELRMIEGRIIAFFAGYVSILSLGVYDDLKGLGAWSKLIVQCAVGVTLWAGGMSFDSVTVFGHLVEFGIFSLPMTVLWVAAIINAINLIDGLDGLAGGVAFFASVSLFVVAWIDGNPVLALFGACLAGASLGFLLYNFEPALIFMGDSGSMTIGYVFAAAALWNLGKRSTFMALVLPVIALGLPIFDTVFAFGRRALSGRSPFSSDRGHIHHRLLDAGFTHRQAVLVLYLVCALLTGTVVVIKSTHDPRWGAVVAGLAIFIFTSGRALMRRSRIAQQQRAEVERLQREAAEAKAEAELARASASEPAGNDDGDQSGGVVVPLRRVRRR